MPIADEIAALNLDPALRDQIVAALSQQADVDRLRAQTQHDALKIQALTLELAHYKRIRFGVRNEALSPEQRDLFQETADADCAAIEVEVDTLVPQQRAPRPRAGRQALLKQYVRRGGRRICYGYGDARRT